MSSKPDEILGGWKILSDGNRIPMIGLGISRIVGQMDVDTAVHAALESGYRLFDTAELYNNETELGVSLESNLPKFGLSREDIFITTKVQTKDLEATNWTEESVISSLSKLRTTYLDLVLVHFPRDRYTGADRACEINKRGRKEVWRKLEELKDRGLIKSIGVSNYEVYHLVELLEFANYSPVVNQIEFHPYFTRQTLVHFCVEKGIFVQAFSSLLWGNKDILCEPAVEKLAKKYDTILYAFAVCSGVGIIPKSSNPVRIRENLVKVAAISLSESELESLNGLDRNTAFCPRCEPWKCL
ncbi:oxidoreductase, aldo/keto reductase family protein [Dictyocaulus viviparus]|uniref:Oxidoreductase, aldo/keto reductase family protein n=1 Tax=Dictyocaulus viviparus TaxID=29172 RepID=A0A0D8YAZ4_DICVI|nr:oxidoreductase, aldo/keto reductase family protein [Dictyocaulus viviparus]